MTRYHTGNCLRSPGVSPPYYTLRTPETPFLTQLRTLSHASRALCNTNTRWGITTLSQRELSSEGPKAGEKPIQYWRVTPQRATRTFAAQRKVDLLSARDSRVKVRGAGPLGAWLNPPPPSLALLPPPSPVAPPRPTEGSTSQSSGNFGLDRRSAEKQAGMRPLPSLTFHGTLLRRFFTYFFKYFRSVYKHICLSIASTYFSFEVLQLY